MFHNGAIYDYHFIIKELVKEFEGNFECLGENTEQYIASSVPIKKKIENKDLEITYKIKFIDSYRFMASSLSNLIDNLSEGTHNSKCSDCGSNVDYIKIKNEKLILECYNYKQCYKKKFNKELIKRFASTYSFYNNNKPGNNRHGNNVFNKFKLNNLGDYHDIYVQIDTLLLADVFENFRDMCLKEYELDPAQACLKKTNIELELLTDYDMLLMAEEGIRGGICHSTHRYAKANNKYMKSYYNNEESSYIQYLGANNLYGWAMSKKLPVNGFKWIDNNETAEPVINEDFIKKYDENNDKGIFLKLMLNTQKD